MANLHKYYVTVFYSEKDLDTQGIMWQLLDVGETVVYTNLDTHWNYRLVETHEGVGVYEVYYSGHVPVARTERPVRIETSTQTEIKTKLTAMLAKPVMVDAEFNTKVGPGLQGVEFEIEYFEDQVGRVEEVLGMFRADVLVLVRPGEVREVFKGDYR